jgi:diguanylate cyclase
VTATEDRSKDCRSVNAKIQTEALELERTKKELDTYKELARIDHLTRVLNRRSFDDEISRIYDENDSGYTCLMMLDIDHFKQFNDAYGHQFGDAILRRVAETIRSNVRPDVTVARVGGEEFAIITRNVEPPVARLIAERVRTAVESMENIDRKSGKNYGTITVSIGLCMGFDADSAPKLYANADEMLYASKKNGRNRVTVYKDPDAASDYDYEGRYLRGASKMRNPG